MIVERWMAGVTEGAVSEKHKAKSKTDLKKVAASEREKGDGTTVYMYEE